MVTSDQKTNTFNPIKILVHPDNLFQPTSTNRFQSQPGPPPIQYYLRLTKLLVTTIIPKALVRYISQDTHSSSPLMSYQLHILFLSPIMAIITMQDNHSKEVNISLPSLTQSSNKATLASAWSHPLNKVQSSQCKHLESPSPRISMVMPIPQSSLISLCRPTARQLRCTAAV